MSFRISSPKSFSQIARGLNQSQSTMQVSLRRLASGLRVNQSADDAAGLAISERLTSKIRAALSTIQNMNLGTSLLQVAEGALNETQSSLMRMRELSLIAANETLTDLERRALDTEFQLLTSQINSIAEQTQFNGIKLLDGQHRAIELQVGSSAEDVFRVNLAKATANELGRQARYTTQRRGVFVSDLATGDVKINGINIRATGEGDDELSYSYSSGSSIAKAKAINHSTEFTGVRAIVGHNVIRAFEPIRDITLGPDRFFKVNGYAVTGIDVAAKDSSGLLVQYINAGYSETGVVAKVDVDGHLVLTAEDGRNITVEYGDGTVRDAIRMIDHNGDPINLVDTVDPVQYDLDGDIAEVTFSGSGGYNGQHSITGDVTIRGVTSTDNTGGYERPRDNVDFVLEVVKPGPIGVATYRYKEQSINDYTNDDLPEDYLFDSTGLVVSQDPTNISIEPSSFYNEASNRTYTLTVTKNGVADAVSLADLPEFTYTVVNNDEASDTSSHLVPIVADKDNSITLEHNVVIDFPVEPRKGIDPNGNGNQVLAVNEDIRPKPGTITGTYNDNPKFVDWAGDRLTDFTFEVTRAGHLAGSDAIAGSNTPQAQVKVTAWVPSLASTFTQTVTLDPNVGALDTVSFRELDISFFGRKGATSESKSLNGSYRGTFESNDSVYVGTANRKYVITMQDAGLINNTSNLNATVSVQDQSGNQLDSHNINVRSGNEFQLGTGVHFEGIVADWTKSKSRVTNPSPGVGTPDIVSKRNNNYNGSNDETGILKITQSGRVGGSAQYRYYYASNPGINVSSGALNSGVLNLSDGVQFNISDTDAPVFSTLNAGSTSISASDASGYTEEQAGSFTALIQDDGTGGQELVVNWSLADGTTSTETKDLNIPLNTPIELGYGTRISFDVQPVDGQVISGTVNANELDTSDQWTFTLESGRVEVGDQFTVNASPRTLALGDTWEVEGFVPEWNVGDTYVINASHNFIDQAPQVLSDTIAFNDPISGEVVMSTVNLTGAGHFNTGDEIRIRTRGFTGTASSSGLYTDNLYPTNYIVTVTKEGPIGVAEYDWVREDGRIESQFGGSGSAVTSNANQLLEEGVEISFADNGTGSSYLAVGDQFIIPAGQKLEYTFAGEVILQSDEGIQIEHNDAEAVNTFGRFIYDGITPNEAGTEGNILQGPMGSNVAESVDDLDILTVLGAEEAIDTIDEAIDQVVYARSNLGAAMNRLESRMRSTSNYMNQLSQAKQRIRDADFATEVSELSRARTQRGAAPLLAQVANLELQRVLTLIDSI